MADKKMEDLLLTFFKTQRLRDMEQYDIERWVQFEEYVSKGDLTDGMKDWAKLLEKDADGNYVREPPEVGFYKIADLDTTNWSDEEWKKLFFVYQNAFMQLASERDKQEKSSVVDYIDEHLQFFKDHGVAEKKASQDTENQIGATLPARGLLKFLRDHQYEFDQTRLESYGVKPTKIADILKGIQDKEYNRSDVFQQNLKRLVKGIRQENEYYNTFSDFPDCSLVLSDDGWEKSGGPGDAALTAFKEQCSDKTKNGLLTPLADYQSKDILEAFKQYEGKNNQISTAIEKAKGKVDYDNSESKDYIPPKREDELSFPQQIQKLASDTWEGYFEKYVKFKGDRVDLNPAAGQICKTLDSKEVKFKPTDGLGKLIEKSKAITVKLQHSNTARRAFKWLTEKLTEFQNDPQLSKAFDGALKNGWQMRHIVRELIIKAKEEAQKNPKDKETIIENAEIAMEVLSVIKYGNTTSKVMDALKEDKDLFNILSNKDLSWNKNEGVKFITAAMDKTIRAAFLGLGYGITIGVNTIRKSGSKFNGSFGNDKTAATMRNSHNQWLEQKNNALQAAQANKQRSEREVSNKQQDRRNALAQLGINDDEHLETNINAKNEELRNQKAQLREKKQIFEEANQTLEGRRNALEQIERIIAEREGIGARIQTIDDALANPDLSAEERNSYAQKKVELVLQQQELLQADPRTNAELEAAKAELERQRDEANGNVGRAEGEYNALQEANNQLKGKVDAYNKATAEIKEWQTKDEANQKILDNWERNNDDVFTRLMAHWDFLETGRDSHTGPLYTRRFASRDSNQERLRPVALEALNAFRTNYRAA